MTAWNDFWGAVTVPTLITWVIGLALVIAFIWKGWPFLRKFVKVTEALLTLPDDMAGLKTDVAQIKHEVLPNGGGSLKDQATRTEAAVKDVQSDLKNVQSEVAHVRRQQASTKTTLARTEQKLTDHLTNNKEQP